MSDTPKKEYTVTEAVREVMNEMPDHSQLKGYEIHNKAISKLIQHGSDRRPLDSTILRLVRRDGCLFGVKAKCHSKSEYIKELTAALCINY